MNRWEKSYLLAIYLMLVLLALGWFAIGVGVMGFLLRWAP